MLMAFEGLNRFVDEIAKEYRRTEDSRLVIVLATYYNTTLSSGKFRSQREYCKQTIRELCPAFFDGMFNKTTKS